MLNQVPDNQSITVVLLVLVYVKMSNAFVSECHSILSGITSEKVQNKK